MPRKRAQQAYDYAERVRARLPQRLRAALRAKNMTPCGLEQESGISRQMIYRVLNGQSKGVSVFVMAQMSAGAGMTLTEYAQGLEDDAEGEGRESVNDV